MDGRMDGWMDGWMDGFMDLWIDGWMKESVFHGFASVVELFMSSNISPRTISSFIEINKCSNISLK